MKFTIKHESRGRMRVHMEQYRMTYEQADTLLYVIHNHRNVTFVKVYEAFPEMPKELNVANIPHEDDSVQVALDIWIDHEQMEAIKKLDSLGVNIHFRLYPGMQGSSCYWKDVKDKYK